MGQFHVEGPNAHELLQSLLSNDLDKIGDGEAQYTLLTNERGGIVDDLIAYRIGAHHYLVVVNAGNRDAAYAWMKEREIRGSEIRDASDEYALLAVQGPRSLERLGLPEAKPFTHAMGELDGVEVMVNRTGYTGELGVELMCPAEDAEELWDAIVARGVTPAGLGARDTLRLEVCYPLHGNDITPGHRRDLGRPRLDVRARRRSSAASSELRRIKEAGPEQKLVAFVMEEKAVPRNGMPIAGGGRGHVGHALADARQGDRHGLRPGGVREPRQRADDRRPRQGPPRDRRPETDLQARGLDAWLQPRTIPRGSSTTPSTTGLGSRATRRPSA